jgi:RNA-directed DNA polymerase
MTSSDMKDKPFTIKARRAWIGQTLEQFESDLKRNLYKIWNRMSSGTYFPPPVRAVSIPKKSGGERILGVPTVSDRIAQVVVKQLIEPDMEALFLPDSYGYRPDKSALQAVGVTRERCWKYDWVLEFDIKGLFDNIDHTLLLKAVRKHVACSWAVLYIERWLTAPMERDGVRMARMCGTPQGGVISPVLANLFLHLHLRLVDEAGLSPPPLGVGMRMTDWFTVGPSKKPQPSRLHFNLAWQSAS